MRKSPFSEAVSKEDLSRMGITAYGDISISDIVFSAPRTRHGESREYGKNHECG